MAAVTARPQLGAETESEPLNYGNITRYNESIDFIREREFPMLQGRWVERDYGTAG